MEVKRKKLPEIKEREDYKKINKKLLTSQQTNKKDRRVVRIAGNYIKN